MAVYNNSKLEATSAITALDLAQEGFRVHPLHARSKKPMLKGWPLKATSDPKIIQPWIEKYPGANFALATGHGVFVLDADGEKGKANIEQWIAEHGDAWTRTRTVRTPTGGRHLWFHYPLNMMVHCSVKRIATGIDIRGWHGLALIPGSIHRNGGIYEWDSEPDAEVLDAPEWLLEKVATDESVPTQRSELKNPVRQKGARNRWANTWSAFIQLEQLRQGFQQGTRHNALWLASKILRWNGYAHERIVQQVHALANRMSPPFPAREWEKFEAEMRRAFKDRTLIAEKHMLGKSTMLRMLQISEPEISAVPWFRMAAKRARKADVIRARRILIHSVIESEGPLSMRQLQRVLRANHKMCISLGTLSGDCAQTRKSLQVFRNPAIEPKSSYPLHPSIAITEKLNTRTVHTKKLNTSLDDELAEEWG